MAEILDKDGKPVKRTVLDSDDVVEMVPSLAGHRKLVERVLSWLDVDKVNAVHDKFFDTPGAPFVRHLLEDFRITLRVDGESVLDSFPEGTPFITVSNHPFGALDGISLIHLVASRRPDYKVMVNMILNRISAMRPNFIAVDAWAQKDPAKRAVSVNGIRQAMRQLSDGEPLGFFPAGAMSKTDWHGHLVDRPWQKSILQIIYKAKVPVIPIYFHGSNSWWFNILGHICWPARSLRLPAEVFRKTGKTMHISVGQPITLADQQPYRADVETLGAYLREQTYRLRDLK